MALRRSVLGVVLFAAAGVAGCAGTQEVLIPTPPAQARGDFTVEIIKTSSQTWIDLGQDAYISVFRVRSGRGAVVYFPFDGRTSSQFSAGRTPLPLRTTQQIRDYNDRAYLAFPEERASQRTFLLVVASRSPQNTQRLLDDPTLLESFLLGRYDEASLVNGIFDLVRQGGDARPWGWACLGEGLDQSGGDADPRYRNRGGISALGLRDQQQCPDHSG
jgi:hypothetical protein